jgi:AbrB family looped-hinge helix DNA binding protein
METRVSSKGQIVIPSELRAQDQIHSGQRFTVERVAEGEYRLVRMASKSNASLLEWLTACPHKGGLIASSSLREESTDDL